MTRIVVTGIGMVTPVGHSREESWNAFLNGVSGAGEVSCFDSADYKVHRACHVKGFQTELPANISFPQSELYRWTYAATREALQEAGLMDLSALNPERCGIALGTLSADIRPWEYALRPDPSKKDNGLTPSVVQVYPPISITEGLAQDFGFEGPQNVFINACSSGNHAIAYAFDLMRRGRFDVMLVGGAEPVSQTEFTHFHNVNSLAPEHCQPFDLNRRGLMIGEGAGMLVLETYESARHRGAEIYAELLGYGLSCDGHHMTAPHPEGDGARRAMLATLNTAKLSPDVVDYVSAHGTGTPLNDKTEVMALKTVFGDRATKLPSSSIKSMIGHSMGAASALESIICCMAIKRGIVPPTINYTTPDPECDIDCVPNEARELNVRYALNNSFAFGGNNATNVFGRI